MGRSFITASALVAFLLSVGIHQAFFAMRIPTAKDLDFYIGQKVTLEGRVIETDVRRDAARYTIEIDSGEFGAGKILVKVPRYPQFHYGDVLRVSGELEAPGVFEDFSYDKYLARFGIYTVMRRARVEKTGEGQGNLFWAIMNGGREIFLEQIGRIFPEPHASFMAGLLVGARKGIPPELMEDFNTVGLTHIIAISGFNITIIISVVMSLLSKVARKKRTIVAIVSIVLFTLFVGASAAVVRASIMGILGLIALHYGRQSQVLLTVLWTASFMVAWNPKILLWDAGFQLSFAAVLGLIYVAPLIERYFKWLPETLAIREAVLMTISAQVMALPILIYHFDRLSIISPVANLLVAFAIPPAMLVGFTAVVLSWIFMPLGMVVAFFGWMVLEYIIKITELFAVVPYASLDVPGMALWMMAVYYLGLIFLVFRKNSAQRLLKRAHVDA